MLLPPKVLGPVSETATSVTVLGAVDGATVVKADIACRNGVVHLIDAVLIPGMTSRYNDRLIENLSRRY